MDPEYLKQQVRGSPGDDAEKGTASMVSTKRRISYRRDHRKGIERRSSGLTLLPQD